MEMQSFLGDLQYFTAKPGGWIRGGVTLGCLQ